ncbi:TetR family transcriptional regulator [Pleionea mediterranea]|uniref:TetR family transcriptional regulator n=2 Tax=Pleionea mediterranea TaxID=523701 RepID=A0A316FSW4_9GAMM|nr:TetR family transcriptional regulator [Pleionea mediterranea]
MAKRGRPRTFNSDDALKKAMLEFWSQGYENTPMSSLIKTMKLNATSIYAAYGSKEALFLKAVDLYCRNDGSRIWSAVQSASYPIEVVTELLHKSAEEFTRPNQPKGCLIIMASAISSSSSPSVYQKLKKLRANNERVLIKRFEETKTISELESDKPISHWKSVAKFYLTVQQGMSIQARDGAKPAELLDIAENAISAWDAINEKSFVK